MSATRETPCIYITEEYSDFREERNLPYLLWLSILLQNYSFVRQYNYVASVRQLATFPHNLQHRLHAQHKMHYNMFIS
jgi:hypothetical protein